MKTLIDGLLRAYPLLLQLSCIISYFITYDLELLMLGIALFLNCRLNNIFKYVLCKPIFGDYIFGYLGKRPKNAKFCGYFINYNEDLSKSYGMPSGHSQSTCFFLSYLICKTVEGDNSLLYKFFTILLFTFISLSVMYSRIHFNCHTLLQVIIGGLVGFILGKLYYDNKDILLKYN